MRTIEWKEGTIVTVDQTALPSREIWIELKNVTEVASAIREMRIRGAPLIGVAAAYGLAVVAYRSNAEDRTSLLEELKKSCEILRLTRPTAVNLFWGIDRIMRKALETEGDVETLRRVVVEEARRLADEDVYINHKIGANGANLISDGDSILTHCNAGSLATVDYGTALAVVREAWREGKRIRVVAGETRPLLQGARLTAYELMQDGIPVTLIADSMAGYLMAKGRIDKVIVGADRIVRDAVINKIGTYSVAVLAREHGIPFYVAAPKSTFDLAKKAEDIVIEERNANEITTIQSIRIAPREVEVENPAFDITPMKYVEAIICEERVFQRWDFKKLVTLDKFTS